MNRVVLDGRDLLGFRDQQAARSNWTTDNTAETLFDRLEAHGRTWKVYVLEPTPGSRSRGGSTCRALKDRLATHFVPFSEFERDAANGTLPDFCLIEPHLDRAGTATTTQRSAELADRPRVSSLALDPPSSILGRRGRSWPASTRAIRTGRLHRRAPTRTTRRSSSAGTSPAAPTTTSHPDPCPHRIPARPRGRCDFKFDRSGYRVPAIIVSPWVDEGIVVNDEYRHTSMLATLRKAWDLGDAFTARDAAARPFDHLLSRDSPRDPATWPDPQPQPVPAMAARPRSSSARCSATSARRSAPASSSTPSSPGTRSRRRSPTPTTRPRQRSSSTSSSGSPQSTSRAWSPTTPTKPRPIDRATQEPSVALIDQGQSRRRNRRAAMRRPPFVRGRQRGECRGACSQSLAKDQRWPVGGCRLLLGDSSRQVDRRRSGRGPRGHA